MTNTKPSKTERQSNEQLKGNLGQKVASLPNPLRRLMVSPNSGRKPITAGPKKGNRLKDFAAVGLDHLLDLIGGQVRSSALGGRRGPRSDAGSLFLLFT